MVALVYKNINLHLRFFHWFYFCFVKIFTPEFGIMCGIWHNSKAFVY